MKYKTLKHKYGAKPVTIDDVHFPSLLEGRCYRELKRLQENGTILMFLMQVNFELPGKYKHKVDFQVFTKEDVIFLEAKGRDLPVGRMKRLQAEEIYNVEIHVVKKAEEILSIIKSIKGN